MPAPEMSRIVNFLLLYLAAAAWVVPAFCWPGAAWLPPAAAEGRAPLARLRRRDAACSGVLVGAGAAASYVARRGRTQGPLLGGATSMAVIDSAVHVWKNDPAYPWAKEATQFQSPLTSDFTL